MTVRSALITVMVRAAQKAGRGLVRDFGEVEQLQVSRKGPGDFVSAADLKAETTLKEELLHARPRFGFLMEESGTTEGEDESRRWIVDPLDGTSNFLHGIPQFAISIAMEQEGEIVAGVVLNPVTNELYWAEKGGGAFLNDRRIRVSARTAMADSLIGTGIPFLGSRGDKPAYMRDMAVIMPQVAGIRRMGAAALDLAYVAAGRFDGFWESGMHAWDVAAGVLLVQEAGGYATTRDGTSSPVHVPEIVAGNIAIHKHLVAALRRANPAAAATPA